MFYYIEGRVAEMLPQLAVIDCGGAGYALNTTNNTLASLKLGEKARLYTYLQVREDCFELYGFATAQEKHCFELLISVSGVGPKAALSILSASTPEALAMAIVNGNEKMLTVAPGIGKKTAQRVILELKDKMAGETLSTFPAQSSAAPASGGILQDASAALAVLGYGSAEVTAALRDIDPADKTVEDIIKLALKKMMK